MHGSRVVLSCGFKENYFCMPFLGDAAQLRFQLFENHNAVLFVEKPG
jgi:hypothetical protein